MTCPARILQPGSASFSTHVEPALKAIFQLSAAVSAAASRTAASSSSSSTSSITPPAAGIKLSACTLAAGVQTGSWLLQTPGASSTVVDVAAPYAREATDAYLRSSATLTAVLSNGGPGGGRNAASRDGLKYSDSDTAEQLAEAACRRTMNALAAQSTSSAKSAAESGGNDDLALAPVEDARRLVLGLATAGALSSNYARRGDNVCSIVISDAEGVLLRRKLLFRKTETESVDDRVEQDHICSLFAIEGLGRVITAWFSQLLRGAGVGGEGGIDQDEHVGGHPPGDADAKRRKQMEIGHDGQIATSVGEVQMATDKLREVLRPYDAVIERSDEFGEILLRVIFSEPIDVSVGPTLVERIRDNQAGRIRDFLSTTQNKSGNHGKPMNTFGRAPYLFAEIVAPLDPNESSALSSAPALEKGETHTPVLRWLPGPWPFAGPPVVVSGSFNPFHEGHEQMAVAGFRAASDANTVVLELSCSNADKGDLEVAEIVKRTQQTAEYILRRWRSGAQLWNESSSISTSTLRQPRVFLMLTKRVPLFSQKAELFQVDQGASFVIGADTSARVLNAKYYRNSTRQMYHELATLYDRFGCKFLVAPRKIGEQYVKLEDQQQSIPEGLGRVFVALGEDEFKRVDVSSTELRAQR